MDLYPELLYIIARKRLFSVYTQNTSNRCKYSNLIFSRPTVLPIGGVYMRIFLGGGGVVTRSILWGVCKALVKSQI